MCLPLIQSHLNGYKYWCCQCSECFLGNYVNCFVDIESSSRTFVVHHCCRLALVSFIKRTPFFNICDFNKFSLCRDRLRTSVNVLGDSYGCAIVAHMSKKQLKEIDEKEELEMQKKNVSFDQGNHKFSLTHDNMELDQASPKQRHQQQSKLPESITSMPQISVYQAPNFENQSA